VLWGLQHAAGLRTEQALALRWSDVLELSPIGGTLAIDRVFVAGEFRDTTKTRKGRDVPIATPLAADLIELRAGVDVVTVAAWAGNSPDIIWRHYAREFDRSHTAERLPLEDALLAAREGIATGGATTVLGKGP